MNQPKSEAQTPPHPPAPRHIAIIMDGNGRWAAERGLPRLEGHRQGAESVRAVSQACIELGVEYLTLYAFSSENWNRPVSEVSALMSLLDQFLSQKKNELVKERIRLMAIGRTDQLPEKTQRKLEQVIAATSGGDRLNLVLALSYGSREEITLAAQSLARDAVEGKLHPGQIDAGLFASRLSTAGMPDPDLLIRTSGEMRVSNFLLWQISYAEMVIVKKFWPDFRREDLLETIAEYHRRHRRFGAL